MAALVVSNPFNCDEDELNVTVKTKTVIFLFTYQGER